MSAATLNVQLHANPRCQLLSELSCPREHHREAATEVGRGLPERVPGRARGKHLSFISVEPVEPCLEIDRGVQLALHRAAHRLLGQPERLAVAVLRQIAVVTLCDAVEA